MLHVLLTYCLCVFVFEFGVVFTMVKTENKKRRLASNGV